MGSYLSAVLVLPVGWENKMNLTKLIAVILLAHCVAGARKLRRNRENARGAKSLVNTFPFNANGGAEEHHDHHEAHEPSQALDRRLARQGGEDVAVDFGAVAAAGPGADDKRCHTTYVTNYESQQEEECEENFRKSCFIEYE